jgi:hypothetical protein
MQKISELDPADAVRAIAPISSPSLNTYMSKLYTQPLGTIPNMEIGNSCRSRDAASQKMLG